jgi:hypothetical protein
MRIQRTPLPAGRHGKILEEQRSKWMGGFTMLILSPHLHHRNPKPLPIIIVIGNLVVRRREELSSVDWMVLL